MQNRGSKRRGTAFMRWSRAHGCHDRAGRFPDRGMPTRRGYIGSFLSGPGWERHSPVEELAGRRTTGKADSRLRACEMVSSTGVLPRFTMAWQTSPRWRRRIDEPGVYTVDLLLWLMGNVRRVYAKTVTALHEIEAEDTVVATLEFENVAVGTLEAGTSVYPGYKRRVEVTGGEGTVILEHDRIIAADLRVPLEEPIGPGEENANVFIAAEVPRRQFPLPMSSGLPPRGCTSKRRRTFFRGPCTTSCSPAAGHRCGRPP